MTGLPSRDWHLGELDLCRPFGIPFDRTTLPPDDEIQDLAAWLAGRFDTLTATPFNLNGDGERCS